MRHDRRFHEKYSFSKGTLGMKTVLVTGSTNKMVEGNVDEVSKISDESNDPNVDVAIETIEQIRDALPSLWENPAVFKI